MWKPFRLVTAAHAPQAAIYSMLVGPLAERCIEDHDPSFLRRHWRFASMLPRDLTNEQCDLVHAGSAPLFARIAFAITTAWSSFWLRAKPRRTGRSNVSSPRRSVESAGRRGVAGS
jgi:hypothetical protein